MRLSTFGFAVVLGVVGCSGGPGEPFSSSGAGKSSGGTSVGDQSPGDPTAGSTGGTTTPPTSSGGTTKLVINATDFTQACTVASDCAAVYSGNLCTSCRCANSAIATSAKAAYDAQSAQSSARCGPQTGACPQCLTGTAFCASGRCTFAAGVAPDGGI